MLTDDQYFYYEVFGRLNQSRPPAFEGLAPIPMSEIFAYLDGSRLHDLDDRETILNFTQSLDQHFRDVMADIKAEMDEASKKAKEQAATDGLR